MTEAIIAISAKDCPSRLTIFPNLNPKKKDDNEIKTEGWVRGSRLEELLGPLAGVRVGG